jgi:acyl carrier protein
VNSLDDFVSLVRDQLGLPVTLENVTDGWDELPGWDSVHLISLLAALERETRRPISLPGMLEAASLQEIYALAVAP